MLFIIPIKLDDITYNELPYQYQGQKGIDFSSNWQKGLIELTNELIEEKKITINKNHLC